MLKITRLHQFKRDTKRIKKRGTELTELKELLECLVNGGPPPRKYRCHKLTGNWVGRYECHVASDVLIIYRMTDTELLLERIGTHSDLFR